MVRKNSKISEGIKLKLNVNIMQQYISNYIKRNEIYYEPKKKDMNHNEIEEKPNEIHQETNQNETNQKINPKEPKFISCSNSFIALTRLVEVIINDIISNTLPKCKKNDFDLYVMTYDGINCSIITDPNLHNNYYKYISSFNSLNNYIAELAPFNYINEYIKVEYEKVMVEKKAFNFLSFIVVSVLNEILYTMSCIIKFTHKSCFNVEMVSAVCEIIFKDNLKSILITKLDETNTLYKQYKEKLREEAAKKKEGENKDIKEVKDEKTDDNKEEKTNENEQEKNNENKEEKTEEVNDKKGKDDKKEEKEIKKDDKKETIKELKKEVNKINKVVTKVVNKK